VRGDRIGLQLPNIPQFVIAYFGVLKAGCVAGPMNVLLKAPEVAFRLGDSHAKAMISWAYALVKRFAIVILEGYGPDGERIDDVRQQR
jgi:acyl-CoA synthetase (AMP-forming)/AMP-acid ligase II